LAWLTIGRAADSTTFLIWTTGGIRSHQRPSEAIRGHQRPPEAIRGHQRPIGGQSDDRCGNAGLLERLLEPEAVAGRDGLCHPTSIVLAATLPDQAPGKAPNRSRVGTGVGRFHPNRLQPTLTFVLGTAGLHACQLERYDESRYIILAHSSDRGRPGVVSDS